MNSIIQKIFSNYLFRVMAAWFGVYIKDKIQEPLAEVDEKVAEGWQKWTKRCRISRTG